MQYWGGRGDTANAGRSSALLEMVVMVRDQGDLGASAQTQNGEQGRINTPLFFRCQVAGEIPQSAQVDGADVFYQYPCRVATDLNLGSERRRSSAPRRGRHQDHRARKEGVGLHDNSEAWPLLFVAHALGYP